MRLRSNRYWSADWAGEEKVPPHFPGFFVHRLNRPALDGQWVEVLRVARTDLGEKHPAGRCTRGKMWFWATPGSGIWLNVGRTQEMGSQHLIDRAGGCSDARRNRQIDTFQIVNAFNGYSHEIVDCRGADMPNADDVWERACPPPHVMLRLGIPGPLSSLHGGVLLEATSDESRECSCDPALDYLNCAGGNK